MRYRHVMQLLLEPQLITPQAHAGIMSLILSRMNLAEPPTREPGRGVCGEEIEVPQMRVEDGIGIVPIAGVMGSGLTKIEKGGGAVDVSDIIRDLDFCESDESVKAVLLNFDSPGGMYQGTPELGDRIKAMQKPTLSFTSGMICSAAYWAACSANQGIVCTRSAAIGSIGVYCAFPDYTKMFEMNGIKMEMFKSDELKGAGTPGVPLNDAQREMMQSRVDKMAAEFKKHVTHMRGNVPASAMLGQALMADDAQEANLVDGIATSINDALQTLKDYVSK